MVRLVTPIDTCTDGILELIKPEILGLFIEACTALLAFQIHVLDISSYVEMTLPDRCPRQQKSYNPPFAES